MGQERVAWAKMAAVLVDGAFMRAVERAAHCRGWYRRTALCELLQLGDEEVNEDRLYRGLDRLLAHKAALEAHLSARCGELFAVEDDVLLYDVTAPISRARRKRTRRRNAATPAIIAPTANRSGRPCRDVRRLFRSAMRCSPAHPQLSDLADDRGDDGGAARRAGTRLDRRPRHGQRRESGVAAQREALHHWRAEVGAEEVRLRPCA